MTIIAMKGAKQPPKAARSRMDTLILTPKIVSEWAIPPFQRPLKVNDKVRAIAEELKTNGGVIAGVLTLGNISGSARTYLLDGQHRIESAKISGIDEFIADVRICTFDSLAEMGEEFVQLNTAIVRLNPDDVLRGLEGSVPTIRAIKEACDFVGYDNIRRSSQTAVLSMSAAIRGWVGSNGETPKIANTSAAHLATDMAMEEAHQMIKFLITARTAWGADPENFRLWAGLNLTMTAWMWRRLVVDVERGIKRSVVLTHDQFKRCLMSVSAARDYVDWLGGRSMNERDRAPCYGRLKAIFSARIMEDRGGKKPLLVRPPWDTGSGRQ